MTHRILVLGSRLGQFTDGQPRLIEALHAACRRSLFPGSQLILAQRLAMTPLVQCLARAVGLPMLWLSTNPACNRQLATLMPPGSSRRWPPDWHAALLADTIELISARPGGNVARLVEALLNRSSPGSPPAHRHRIPTIRIAVGQTLVPPQLAKRWLQLGAAVANNPDANNAADIVGPLADPRPPRSERLRLTSSNELLTGDYLYHWTRACPGPWPGQTSEQYLNDLLFHPSRSSRSAEASLRHILTARRLVGTNRLTRSSHPVVCWTEVAPWEWPSRRVYRKHLRRWDFEPFGIGVRKQVLRDFQARPVTYGTDTDWSNLPQEERPFFQIRSGRNRSLGTWESEREWRTLGDVPLDRLGKNDACLIVPTSESAQRLTPLHSWPFFITNQ